ncbi:MAG: L,D-transpeptidase family protein [Paracoccaceae bacterium]|jgi:murein L,D-transpeptidase YafK
MTKFNRRTVLSVPLALGIANVARAEPSVSSRSAPIADFVVVFKSSRKLGLYRSVDGKPVLLRTYRVALGFAPRGDKGQQGDGRTPEGTYFINRRNPNSAYHLSLGISYPDANDRADARAKGVSPGGDIFIHGGPTNFRDRFKRDWTAGCISVSDKEIEEIWAMVPMGTPISIRP